MAPLARPALTSLPSQCLWKVSKTVKESLENRNLLAPRLLSDINQFLVTIPPAEWRRRATDNIPLADMPLRTVKTILQQVVSVLKGKVFDELGEVDQAENSFVYQYLHRLANQPSGSDTNGRPSSSALSRQTSSASLGSQRREEPAKSSPAESPPRTTARPAPPPVTSPGGSDIAVNQRLKEIFDMIGDPNNSRAVRYLHGQPGLVVLTLFAVQGIAALYEFQKEHPEAAPRIATWCVQLLTASVLESCSSSSASRMAGTGSYFQTYLKRALANLEAADRERGVETPASPTSASSSTCPSMISCPRSNAPQSLMLISQIAATRPSSRPTSSASAAPGTPTRSSRLSLGPNATSSTPQQSARLQELHSVFGFGQKE